jgi:hypothetical protein
VFFNGFTLLMMIIGAGIGFGISRWTLTTEYLVDNLAKRVGHEYDNEGQVVIYTGLYDEEQEVYAEGY